MYYQNYEDYIRSVLGYPNYCKENTYENEDYYNNEDYLKRSNCDLDEETIENMYPDIYKKINPIIKKECDNLNNEKITKEKIDSIVDKIYFNIEPNKEVENRQLRRPNNPLLRDLIYILILERLFRRQGSVRPRPPRPNIPPFPNPRPPFMRNEGFNDYIR